MTRFPAGQALPLVLVSLAFCATPAHPARSRPLTAVSLAPSVLRDNRVCLGCHGTESGAPGVDVVDGEELSASAHRALVCADCHNDVKAVPHAPGPGRVDCSRCHPRRPPDARLEDAKLAFATPGLHEAMTPGEGRRRPACVDCHATHGTHDAEGRSPVGGRHMLRMCGACHDRCAGEYAQSIHGRALLAGNRDSPSCATCHPEHGRSPEVERAERLVVCVSCHDDPGLQVRYALPGHRLSSYLGSYHGAAASLGETRAADCASCHGTHLILPSSDPRSTVSQRNLKTTCGGCHPGMKSLGASGHFHVQPSPGHDRVVFWVRLAYQVLVCGMMIAFLSYIALDLLAGPRRRAGQPPHEGVPGAAGPEFERLTLHQRVQHWTLILIFTLLIVTGLPLAFPRWDISHGVVAALGGMGVRAVVHRAAAVALTLLVGYHLAYVLFSRRGHWEFRQLLPSFRDVGDLLAMVAYFFSFSRRRPAFDRYNYIEKFEYFAVAWGSVVMITSGIVLWTPHLSLSLVPKWVIDVALVVHSWEAILAFLAIIIWHMYNVHWNPAVFPMSRVWLTGRISLEEFRENHPREYERHMRREDPPGGEQT